jgi:hypothetical protein
MAVGCKIDDIIDWWNFKALCEGSGMPGIRKNPGCEAIIALSGSVLASSWAYSSVV